MYLVSTFKILKFLFPEANCVAYPVRVQLFLLKFYCLSKRNLKKKGHRSIEILPEFFPGNVSFDGVGSGGTVIKSVF